MTFVVARNTEYKMNGWSKEQLEEMVGDDIIDQMAFVSGCFKHRLVNDKDAPDGWIISDEVLRKFAKLIAKGCAGRNILE